MGQSINSSAVLPKPSASCSKRTRTIFTQHWGRNYPCALASQLNQRRRTGSALLFLPVKSIWMSMWQALQSTLRVETSHTVSCVCVLFTYAIVFAFLNLWLIGTKQQTCNYLNTSKYLRKRQPQCDHVARARTHTRKLCIHTHQQR